MLLGIFQISLLMSGCSLNQSLESSTLKNSPEISKNISTPEQKNSASDPEVSRLDTYLGSLTNVDGLLGQLKKTDSSLLKTSKETIKHALDAQADGDWGAAAKGFGESIVFMPTNEGLLGYALSTVMTNVESPTPEETLNTKLRNFREAIEIYKTTIEFSRRSGKPLSDEQQKLIKRNLACLEKHLNSPDPKAKTCELISKAFKASKIQ
jgi:hypothetical protein